MCLSFLKFLWPKKYKKKLREERDNNNYNSFLPEGNRFIRNSVL